MREDEHDHLRAATVCRILPRSTAGVGRYEIAFALNLAVSFGYALLVSLIKRIGPEPADDLCYWFFRASVRSGRLLHLGPVAPVSTADVQRHLPAIREQVGRELVLLLSVLAATTLVVFLLRMVAGTRLHYAITTRLLGPSLMFAFPISYIVVMHTVPMSYFFYGDQSFWGIGYPSLLLVLGVEVLAAIIAAVAQRIWVPPGWMLGVVWFMHLGLWFPILWTFLPSWEMGAFFGFFVPRALVIAWVVIATIWVLRLRDTEPAMPEAKVRGGAWTLAGATAIAISAFIWLPHPVRSVADPSRRQSVTVELSRGPCYGMCPTYSVRVRGDGVVEYTGDRYVRERGATATLSPEQVTAILEKLESVRFFGIEDHAFMWSWDTATVAVAVSVDGVTHRVVSDSGGDFIAAKSGAQASFVRAANEIEQIVGSRRWVD